MAKAAIRYLEETVSGLQDIEGVVLRYGGLYGPGTPFREDGEYVKLIKKRGFPIIGDGGGVWSFTHIDDAVPPQSPQSSAALRASTTWSTTSRRRLRLPYLTDVLGEKPPRHVPRLARKTRRRRSTRHDDDREPRLLEREGKARARLAAARPKLARPLPPRVDRGELGDACAATDAA
jgi:hypothetical protein